MIASPEDLENTLTAYWRTALLRCALQLDIFTKLAPAPKTSQQLASELGFRQRGLRILLDALTAIGLLERVSSAYRLSGFSKRFLVSTELSFIGTRWLSLSHPVLWDAFGNLAQAIRSGGPIESLDSKYWHDHAFVSSNSASTLLDAAELCNLIAGSNPIPMAKVLEIGCGDGIRLCSLAQRFRSLRGTGVDLDSVVEVASKVASQMHVEDRITFVREGVWDEEPGTGFDVAIVSQVFQLHSPDWNLSLLERLYKSIRVGGLLVIGELYLLEDRSGPLEVLLISLGLVALTEGGDAYTQSELSTLTEKAGFTKLDRHGEHYMVCRRI